MTDADWYLIDSLLLDLAAINHKLASPTYAAEIEQQLLANSDNPATRSYLRAMATHQHQPTKKPPEGGSGMQR